MFKYLKEELVLEQGNHIIPLQKIAEKEKYPFYIYDLQGMKDWYQEFVKQVPQLKIFFAMKSNNNKEVLKIFKDLGSGVDVVSGGEANLALSIGFTAQQIIFSGVGKSQEELEMAISKNFFQINVESFEELQSIVQISKKLNQPANIGLRLNPNVDFESHPYIKTGLTGHKFGIDESDLPQVLNFIQSHKKELTLQGLSMHLGSQIFDLDPLYQAINNIRTIYTKLQKQGFPLKHLDIGGGLAVDYQVSGLQKERQLLQDFSQRFSTTFKGFSGEVLAEPGRFLIARFGMLCTRIEYIKKTPHKKFIILNSGMNHFLRPALYKAKHRILEFSSKLAEAADFYDIVGPICETGDIFAENYSLNSVKTGDWLALADVGAYGYVMSNQYNLQIPVQELAFFDGKSL